MSEYRLEVTGPAYVLEVAQEPTVVVTAPGPQGPAGSGGGSSIPGPKGDKGDQGEPGPVGPQGPTGLTGAKGDTGSQGAQGAQGMKGDTGSQGLQGANGAKGDTGLQGPQGATGAKGDTGSQGAPGATGATGADGPQGLQGPKGDKGDTGAAASLSSVVYGTGKPPVGWGLDSPHILSTSALIQTTALRNAVRFMPFDVPEGCTWDALQAWLSTVESGGDATRTVALYRSNSDGTLPDVNGGLLRTATLPTFLTGTGAKLAVFDQGPLVNPPPGRYWNASLLRYSTQPTTFATPFMVNNALRIPCAIDASAGQSSGNQQNNGSRYLVLGSQTDFPNALTNPTWVVGGDSLTIHLLMRRSA